MVCRQTLGDQHYLSSGLVGATYFQASAQVADSYGLVRPLVQQEDVEMFQDACRRLVPVVTPIMSIWRTKDGTLNQTVGVVMILNESGWFVTAGHILLDACKLLEDIDSPTSDVTNGAVRVGPVEVADKRGSGTELKLLSLQETAHVLPEIDLGIGRLEGYKPKKGQQFPRFREKEVELGEFLCRIGYPLLHKDFRVFESKWFPDKGFQTTMQAAAPPVFVNEALVSRFVRLIDRNTGKASGCWIETSSPGLKGQSGGPLTDSVGLICGIQVKTAPYPLGFRDDEVLYVGRAVRVDTVRDFLDVHNVEYLTG